MIVVIWLIAMGLLAYNGYRLWVEIFGDRD